MGLTPEQSDDDDRVRRQAGETPPPDAPAGRDVVEEERSRVNGCDGCALVDLRLS
jgi:hypothetical protein